MKRGLITWDRSEIAPAVFDRRIDSVRTILRERNLGALLIYSELWRSNQARYFANYMPYFNRALLVLPVQGQPALLCGLSPRTYRWIQSVTPIEDVRPAGNFVKPLSDLATERGWTRLGAMDVAQFPHDLATSLRTGPLEIVNVESDAVFHPAGDEMELALRRKAATMARNALETELQAGIERTDYEQAGILEGKLRRAGAEDLVLLFSDGSSSPSPANGRRLGAAYSISLALEYRGHWVHVTRSLGGEPVLAAWREKFSALRSRGVTSSDEALDGSYPYECGRDGGLISIHAEIQLDGHRFFHGDTCRRGPEGWELL